MSALIQNVTVNGKCFLSMWRDIDVRTLFWRQLFTYCQYDVNRPLVYGALVIPWPWFQYHPVCGLSKKTYPSVSQCVWTHTNIYHASDKNVWKLIWIDHGHMTPWKKDVLGVEIRIGQVIEFEAGGEQPKMADDELVAMDLSRWFSIWTDFWL